jgi:hypothetical protein
MIDDDDIRNALARAHEPAPAFAAVRGRRPRRFPAVHAFALATIAVAIVVFAVAWPSSPEPTVSAELPLDLQSPALSSTTLAMPLDSLLDVPGLAALETTPKLVTGGLP